jgi:hypothetical protein
MEPHPIFSDLIFMCLGYVNFVTSCVLVTICHLLKFLFDNVG